MMATPSAVGPRMPRASLSPEVLMQIARRVQRQVRDSSTGSRARSWLGILCTVVSIMQQGVGYGASGRERWC